MGIPPIEITSSTHSLTWRDFLIGLTTCLFNPKQPPPHGERVAHMPETFVFNPQPPLSPRKRVSHRTDNMPPQPRASQPASSTTIDKLGKEMDDSVIYIGAKCSQFSNGRNSWLWACSVRK
jgi:hypothetical protein